MVLSPAAVSAILRREGMGTADQRPLDPPVLEAQRDLQVEDRLPVALEAEVAGLDDARVDRPHRHLVDLVALHPVEVRHRRAARSAGRSQGSAAPFQGRWQRTGLNQGWPSGMIPNCSAISRSKRWAWGHSGVRDG